MNKQLATFPFSGNNVRVLGTKIEPWFVAVDVLRILGVHEKNMTRTIDTLDDDEKKMINLAGNTPSQLTTNSQRGNPNVWLISEPGFYKIMFRSRNPIAKKFTRFVAHEVLPSIRRYGYYKLPHV